MKLTKIKSVKFKILLIIIIFIYFIYLIHWNFLISSQCSHHYDANKFETCALSNKTCNITILLKSYFTYRNCIINNSPSKATYVVFDAVNGLGNRVLGLIAVTTYALVTGRVLLINWHPGDNHLTSFEDLFLPLSSSLSSENNHYQYSFSRLACLIKNRWINEIEHTIRKSRIPTDWAFYFDREMLCHDTKYGQSWFSKLGFTILNLISDRVQWIRTDQYFIPLLKRNHDNKKLFSLLFHDGQVFSVLAKHILQPITKVKTIVEQFQNKYHLDNSTITIGVHMRSWSENMIDHIGPFKKCIQHVIQNIIK